MLALVFRRAVIGVGAALACAAAPAFAQTNHGQTAISPRQASLISATSPPPRRAEIRVFSNGQHAAARGSELINGAVASICVASTTGQFRLRVASQMGGALIAQREGRTLDYSVRFEDPTGAVRTVPMRGSELVFEGRNRLGVTCAQGANATLTIQSGDRELLAAVAGDYFEQLSLSVEPL